MRIKYNVRTGITRVKSKTLQYTNKLTLGIAGSVAVLGVALVPATLAAPGNGGNTMHGQTSSTTLDACGYFTGTQTASEGKTVDNGDGSTTTTEHGTWTGVMNNYVNTPVASLGDVHGAYSESQTTDSNGVTTGTESFTSNAGKITQTYQYGTGVPGGFVVSVTGTRDLAFMTSDTNGHCYMGAFPRP